MKVNNFDVLKQMAAENQDIRLASTENITNMKMVKAGTQITIGVPGNIIGAIYHGDLSACLMLFDSKQFAKMKARLESAPDELDAQIAQVGLRSSILTFVSVYDTLPALPDNHIEASEDVIVAIIGPEGIERWDRACLCASRDKWAKDGILLNWQPTHWLPLPQPPQMR